MDDLHGKDLKEIMNEDIYYALPVSVAKWLNKIDLNASQRLIIERIISHALQRPTRSQECLATRLSASLISETTSIKERTVKSSLQKLVGIGLLSKLNVNQKGTLYKVNLSSEIKNLVKYRFKKSTPNKEEVPLESSTISDGPQVNEKKLADLTERLNSINSEIKDNLCALPENFSPLQMLKGVSSLNDVDVDKLTKLQEMRSKIVYQIDQIRSPGDTTSKQLNSSPIKGPEKPTFIKNRFISQKDATALSSRIKKLSFITSDAQKTSLVREILWSIRFGWYKEFKGSTFHCVNHALKLIRNNDWRTPAGYKEEQIVGLTMYHGV